MSDEQQATARVNAALNRGEKPTGEDLMACDLAAVLRAARVMMPAAFTVTTTKEADVPQGQVRR